MPIRSSRSTRPGAKNSVSLRQLDAHPARYSTSFGPGPACEPTFSWPQPYIRPLSTSIDTCTLLSANGVRTQRASAPSTASD